ncbi:uroporphyrinogen-III synthase [Alcanivorax quisquiliarum]|uniref:Uroporphyrinogen-III synthase n=1 Tax=Alcanivorax quisquiliarum TaxID=2933565 RepID=A0ABT0EA98_9GAMM|nr:uroporphyrinogen-III synthase [Alcanivorax quisquiliarum]MCK0538765.1 uroporphyrinogen-III synthase [Alcanivorax quisquiliarum]
MRVLVTRPAGQQQALMAMLAAAGFEPLYQSALEIEPCEPDARARQCLMNLDQYHAVFLVSTNAVRYGLAALADYWPQWPVGVHWIAVGTATARALEQAGLAALAPDRDFNSEAVLTLPVLQQLAEKKILVLRGDSGRELFTQTLRERGAEVDRVTLYRRACNAAFQWPPAPLDVILVTSVESWHCLQQHGVPEQALLVAGSARIGAAIDAAGYGNLIVAASPHDEDMVACLTKHLRTR